MGPLRSEVGLLVGPEVGPEVEPRGPEVGPLGPEVGPLEIGSPGPEVKPRSSSGSFQPSAMYAKNGRKVGPLVGPEVFPKRLRFDLK